MWSPTGATLGDTAGVAADVIDDIVAPVTGTYLVLVASYDSGFDGTGTYRLTMTHTPGPITVSPGDDGGPLTIGVASSGTIDRGDLDVWTFTATAGQHVSVNIGEISDLTGFQPWIRLWTPAGGNAGRHGRSLGGGHQQRRRPGDRDVPRPGREFRQWLRRNRDLQRHRHRTMIGEAMTSLLATGP